MRREKLKVGRKTLFSRPISMIQAYNKIYPFMFHEFFLVLFSKKNSITFMLKPLRDEAMLRPICDIQSDCLVLQIVFGSVWFSLIFCFCGCQNKNMVTFN